MKLRQMEIVTDVDKLNVDLQATFMKYKTIKQWAYIIHDRDDTRPHYHIYLHFDSSVDTSLVANWFKVPENLVNKVKGRQADMLMYLTHGNESQKNKHQYDVSEVIANFDFEKVIEESKILGDFEHFSYAQQLMYVDSLPVQEKTKAFRQLEQLWRIKCQSDCLKNDRNLQVIFITGKSGTGKTYYAKKLFDKMNLDYCISSSSNDPFQDYLGQKGMILDDLRDKAFELADLLKILDNNTSSSVKSRFSNKVFNGEVIIITSSVPINYWYKEYRSRDGFEDLLQLYRRISTYIKLGERVVYIYDDGLDEKGYPKGQPIQHINEVSIIKDYEPKKKRKISELFRFYDSELPF